MDTDRQKPPACSTGADSSSCCSSRATYFAPPGRDAPEEFRRKVTLVQEAALLNQALDAMSNMTMILNANRQIVAANEALLGLWGAASHEMAGKRPGEAVGCIRADEGPDGCGTACHCATCGAVEAILESQRLVGKVVRECRILAETPDGVAPLDLKVTASPLRVGDESFIMVAVEDISRSKRLAVLQRTFFHDVLNTAGCIQGYAQYLLDEVESDPAVHLEIANLASQLIEEIRAQRDLVDAESGELSTEPTPLRTRRTLEDLRLQYVKHPIAEGREITLASVWDGAIIVDRRLLSRVLGNMVKNALEATDPGRAVTVSCADHGNDVAFAVHNPEVMPGDVQLQIFQRSFSTKGVPGRGVGTYSMKLFGERYLRGKVDFTSRLAEGTVFTLTIPKVPFAVI